MRSFTRADGLKVVLLLALAAAGLFPVFRNESDRREQQAAFEARNFLQSARRAFQAKGRDGIPDDPALKDWTRLLVHPGDIRREGYAIVHRAAGPLRNRHIGIFLKSGRWCGDFPVGEPIEPCRL